MGLKIKGAEFKAWLASDWGPDAFWDDYEFKIDGVDHSVFTDYDEKSIADDAKVEVLCGVVVLDESGERAVDVQKHIRAFLKARTHKVLTFDVPVDQVKAVQNLVKEFLSKKS